MFFWGSFEIILLNIPQNEGLKHIRLSARKIKRIEALGCYYAKEGKIIELATLRKFGSSHGIIEYKCYGFR